MSSTHTPETPDTSDLFSTAIDTLAESGLLPADEFEPSEIPAWLRSSDGLFVGDRGEIIAARIDIDDERIALTVTDHRGLICAEHRFCIGGADAILFVGAVSAIIAEAVRS